MHIKPSSMPSYILTLLSEPGHIYWKRNSDRLAYCRFHVTLQSRDFSYFHFWQIFDELYLLQIFTVCLDISEVRPRVYILDACQFLELETTSLSFSFLTGTWELS